MLRRENAFKVLGERVSNHGRQGPARPGTGFRSGFCRLLGRARGGSGTACHASFVFRGLSLSRVESGRLVSPVCTWWVGERERTKSSVAFCQKTLIIFLNASGFFFFYICVKNHAGLDVRKTSNPACR